MSTRADRRSGRRDSTERPGGSQPDKQAALQDAALLVLDRDGVLAGLSLQSVAKEAGVSQALINHHFGSRRGLLRSALAAKRDASLEAFRAIGRRRPGVQARRVVRAAIADPQWAMVMALLALDRDEEFEPFVSFDEEMATLRAEIAAGRLVDDFDSEAMHAVVIAVAVGWSLLRERAARQTGIALDDFDRRVQASVTRMVDRTAEIA